MVDLKLRRKVKAVDLHQKVDWTPYEGRELKGWPIMTMKRGEILFKDNELLGKPGTAEFLPMNL
jgi:dihydropyrimidinase